MVNLLHGPLSLQRKQRSASITLTPESPSHLSVSGSHCVPTVRSGHKDSREGSTWLQQQAARSLSGRVDMTHTHDTMESRGWPLIRA